MAKEAGPNPPTNEGLKEATQRASNLSGYGDGPTSAQIFADQTKAWRERLEHSLKNSAASTPASKTTSQSPQSE